MMPTASPRRIRIVASRRICFEPKDLETLTSSIRGGSSSSSMIEEEEEERGAREGCFFVGGCEEGEEVEGPGPGSRGGGV